ncbi:unnamed protein product [Blepharisma stoltei]|uniref:Methyltransferase type 11 domain-containing protein n=1 Tax=Blepharisma stoltei TaxID=1481888 RepID=A0AAU9JWW8_9CILI|nr:unnamed protein product [Blepharisma stoltei]
MADELDLPDTFPDFSSVEYWDSRYESEINVSYDWLVSFTQLRSIFLSKLHDNFDAEILIVGSGNSHMGEELIKEGYKNITNIDFSPVLVHQMNERTQDLGEEMEYITMDACNITFPVGIFDLIIDKCTLDCILCGDNNFQRASSYLQGVYRCLKPGGSFIVVSYGVPDSRLGYLKNKFLPWGIEQAKITKSSSDSFASFEQARYHYLYICTKSLT